MIGESMQKVIISIGLSFALNLSAFSYCAEPSLLATEPSPPSTYGKPNVPYCLNSYSWRGEHSCDGWELDSYFDEVEDYQRKLRRYLEEVADYEASVQQYVYDAIEFARCENREILSQHE
ncbi:MAG: hypothetical protein Hens3KO_18840 [Henriciella sp.]